jgi:hypothetical protein
MVNKKIMLGQLILRAVILLLFFLGIFIEIPGIRYIFILFIIANLVLGFINHKKDIFMNIIFIGLAPWLFIPILEYLITMIISVLLALHLGLFYLWFRKDGVVEVKNKNVKGKKGEEEKKFHMPVWLIILLTVVGTIILLLIFLALLAFGSVSSGVQVAG